MEKWKSAITKIEPNKISVRGYSIDMLMGRITFAQSIYLVLKGNLPSENIGKLLDAGQLFSGNGLIDAYGLVRTAGSHQLSVQADGNVKDHVRTRAERLDDTSGGGIEQFQFTVLAGDAASHRE